MKANYMVIGYGWRADFYYRIAKLLPEQFSICAGVLRTATRAKEVALQEHVFTTVDLDKALSRKPDFAVLCVPREIVKDYLVQLMEKGIPVLCETPPGKNIAELNELWTLSQKYNGRIQIVEQYFFHPEGARGGGSRRANRRASPNPNPSITRSGRTAAVMPRPDFRRTPSPG